MDNAGMPLSKVRAEMTRGRSKENTVKNEKILQRLRERQEDLLTEDELDEVASWEPPIDPSIFEAQNCEDGTWEELVLLIRVRRGLKREAPKGLMPLK
jgi:hypothetical protein